VSLIAVDAGGAILWTRIYGGLFDESLGDLEVLPDGGLLLAGRSDSLGVDSEAWLLRTDSCGEISGGCIAVIERREGPIEALARELVLDPYDPQIDPVQDVRGTLQAYPTAARVFSVTDEVVVARQCSGFSKDVPPVEEVLLTVRIDSGAGRVREDVSAGEPPLIDCITTCQVAVPVGTVVVLRATPDAGFLTPTWTGGDCGPGPAATCSVALDVDRTVTVSFPPDEGTGTELHDLTVDFRGAGTGSVEVQPLNATCTQDCTFEDLAAPGDEFLLIATPDPGSTSAGWEGVDDRDGNVASVVFGAADRTVTVTFGP